MSANGIGCTATPAQVAENKWIILEDFSSTDMSSLDSISRRLMSIYSFILCIKISF